MNPAEAFLLDQVPMALRTKVPTVLKTAYAAAKAIIADEPILNIPSAEDNWGRFTQWAVDFGFLRLVQSGDWPFDARWRMFAKPTGRYLEIAASHSLITISQVAEARKQPRDAVFRANKRLNNQGVFKFGEEDDERAQGLPHILLVHGHQQLDFAHLGVPNEDQGKGYLYRTPNLLLMPHEVVAPEPAVEQTDIEAVMTLKEEIDRWRRDTTNE